MPSDIPKARRLVASVRDELMNGGIAKRDLRLAEDLDHALSLMVRDPWTRSGKPRSKSVTKRTAQRIRDYAAAHPEAHVQDIANAFHCNPGRVSEALARLR